MYTANTSEWPTMEGIASNAHYSPCTFLGRKLLVQSMFYRRTAHTTLLLQPVLRVLALAPASKVSNHYLLLVQPHR